MNTARVVSMMAMLFIGTAVPRVSNMS
jgi:hypothetical protein